MPKAQKLACRRRTKNILGSMVGHFLRAKQRRRPANNILGSNVKYIRFKGWAFFEVQTDVLSKNILVSNAKVSIFACRSRAENIY